MPCFGFSLTPFVASQYQQLRVQFKDGRISTLSGPLVLHFSPFKHSMIEVIPVRRFVAGQHQYLSIQYRNGQTELLRGPLERTFDEDVHQEIKVIEIKQFVADQSQYLVVQYHDGRVEHIRGPVELAFNPFEHVKMSVISALRLAANEAVVVYRKEHAKGEPTADALVAKQELLTGDESGARIMVAEQAGQQGAAHVERRVVHGPAVFMPDANEWVHTFSWHGSIGKNGKGSKTGTPGDEKVPHALEFQILRCMPDQMYYTVREVRTSDDARIDVHLMLFYEMVNIETMLDSTNDLLGDFINAVAADVMTFAAKQTYELLLQDTSQLSHKDTYPILAARMTGTGTKLLKVVYRGYSTSHQLQEMHDQAIMKRTKLRLESDAALGEQEKRAMELRGKQERAEQERRLEEEANKHRNALLDLQQQRERAGRNEEHAQKLRHAHEENELELAQQRAAHDEELRRLAEERRLEAVAMASRHETEVGRLRALKEMGVDLTQYLCAMAVVRPDQHLKIDTAVAPNVHVELPKRQH